MCAQAHMYARHGIESRTNESQTAQRGTTRISSQSRQAKKMSQLWSCRCAWMAKSAHIRGEQVIEMTCGKSLRIVFTFAGTQMLLVNAVVVVAKLVHKDVQEHERPSLPFREAT